MLLKWCARRRHWLAAIYYSNQNNKPSNYKYNKYNDRQHKNRKSFVPITASLTRLMFGCTLYVTVANAQSMATEQSGLHHEPIQALPFPQEQNPDKLLLGEKLFKEQRLADNNKMSCASCHDLGVNGADSRIYARGQSADAGVNTPTVFNSRFNHRLFWDGRAKTLEEQIDFVIADEREFATSWPVVVAKLKQDEDYQARFNKVYPDGITAANIRDAIASFERSLVTVNSRFDRYLRGDAEAINAKEKQGYQLFKNYGCIACHQGRNVGGNLFQKLGVFKAFFYNGKALKKVDLGRFNVTGQEEDKHVFRVPSLRLVALTPPYFHDGSAKTLRDAIKVMAEYQLGRTIPEADIQLIIAFLKTLAGEYQGRALAGSYEEALNSER